MGENGFCATSKSAQDLLTEFQQTGQEAPFAEIARRYAGMVYNVALRVTHDAHDAEDATQATFLTLAVHAKTSGKIRFLGPWLKKVSHRLALDIRRSKKRRSAREQRHAASNGEANGNGHDLPISSGLHTEELRNILREEIDRLPAKYRMPLILYYFGGLTPEEIGEQLHCNTSTLGVRLHRGRKMLAESLGARGISMNAAVVAAVLTGLVDSFVKDSVVHAAGSAATHASAASFVSGADASGHVMHLIRIATSALKWARMKAVVGVAVLMFSTFALGREALKHVDLSNLSILRQLNPMRLIQPLLDRIFVPRLISQNTETTSPTQLAGPTHSLPTLPVLTDFSDINLAFTSSAAPRSIDVTLALPNNVQRANLAASQPPVILQSQPIMSVAAARSTAPVYQLPPAALNRPQPLATPLSGSSAGVVAVSSSSRAPSFVMPAPNSPIVIDFKTGNVLLDSMPAGDVTLPDTITRVPTIVIGDASSGKLNQDTGTLQASRAVVVGKQTGSKGTYQISKTATVESPSIVVGDAGQGTVTQTGGTVVAKTPDQTGQVTLGNTPTGSGTYTQNNGLFSSDVVVVGNQGQGQFNQNGGTTSIGVVKIGAGPGSTGTWSSSSLTPILTSFSDPRTIWSLTDFSQSPAAPVSPQIVVGGEGVGAFVVQPENTGTTVIQEQPDAHGSSLVIRYAPTGDGVFQGTGIVNITGPFVQNARVIADGYGTHKLLDFSSASKVSNTIENAPNGGTNGWYAKKLGSILLPRITINGSKNYTWGEDTLDDTIDLVNSVRLVPHSASVDGPTGSLGITLLDPNDPDVASLPDGRKSVGLWAFDAAADFSSVDVIVRFDDQLASALKISPADLGLWAYQDKWVPIDDSSFELDMAQDLISGSINGSLTYLAVGGLPSDLQQQVVSPLQPAVLGPASLGAVSTPEPATALFAAALGSLLALRRPRRRI